MVLEKQIFFENKLLMLPRQPIKLSNSDKSLKKCEELFNKHFYMWNMERIRITASEEMSFENVDGRRTDGRTPDASIYYKLTCEPTAQVS